MPILEKILRTQLLPWTAQNARERFIIAHAEMHQQEMPYGVHLTPREIKGKRVIVKNTRNYRNSRDIVARWPKSGLIEVPKYKLTCVLGGAIDYPIANYSLRCGAGSFIFFPPGLPHTEGKDSYIDTTQSTFCETLSFLLHPNGIQYWVNNWKGTEREYKENAVILNQRVISLFQTLMEEIFAQSPVPLAQEALLTAFFSLTLRELYAKHVSFIKKMIPKISRIIEA